ncbi:carbohydrate-binding protein [Delftia tsuruhatensis]|uniref:carbohydrate-binding protein n=1 Tax=Delftia tsuruhatensis TaxID=180282 RepID=UPI0030CC13B1
MSFSSLTVVAPLAVTPAMLVSTNVPETDYPEWAAGTTYTKGQRVILAAQHKIYESTADSNTGNNPATPSAEPKWAEVGPTNRWKPFDKSVSSQVKQANSITYRIKPGQAITSLGLLNVAGATSIRVRVIDPTYGTVYDKTTSMATVPVATGWWEWYFGERQAPTQALLQDLPSFPMADILIDIAGTAALAVGVILMGQRRVFALGVKSGARVGIQDYSRKERTEFGDVVLVERAYAKRASFQLLLQSSEVDSFNDFCASVRATPCLWIGSNRFESTVIYGFYKNFEIVLSYYDYADSELELEGLT